MPKKFTLEKALAYILPIIMEERNDFLLLPSTKALLSPSQRYSLKILEMNNVDLVEHLEKCLGENPFLESDRSIANFSDINQLSEIIARQKTFSEEICSQMLLLRLTDKEKNAALQLLDGIVENRYITNDLLQRVCAELQISMAEIFQLIKKLQQLSPLGLFSFNFKDKIKKSLEAENKYNRDYEILIQHLDVIPKFGLSKLGQKCNFDQHRLSEMLSEIGRLGIIFDAAIDDNDCLCRIPDMILEHKTQDNFEYSLNDYLLPPLSINRELYDNSMKKCRGPGDKKYMQENFSAAELLVKSVKRRQLTLLKILQEVAKYQRNFFHDPDALLRPLEVKSLANSLSIHESTVHRAIADKTVATPRGTFFIKELMPKEIKTKTTLKAVSKTCENSTSDYSVKEYMKALIKSEPQSNPYSDNCLTNLLNSNGVEISRRTVSKYRKAMAIPNASTRARGAAKITERANRLLSKHALFR